jgi:hypothetical protein
MTTEEKYYLIQHAKGVTYEWANSALEAINLVRETEQITGAYSARLAVYGEWKRNLTHGGELAAISCLSCGVSVDAIEARENCTSYCVECSHSDLNE